MKKTFIILMISFVIFIAILILSSYFKVQLKFFDIITTFALIAGPVLSVFITRNLDEERFKKGRKIDLFRILMRDKGLYASQVALAIDFTNALNLVPIEFSSDKEVIKCWGAFFDSVCLLKPLKDDVEGERNFNLRIQRKLNQSEDLLPLQLL